MKVTSLNIIGDANYIPTAKVPDYQEFIKFVKKVRPRETKIKEKPAILIIEAKTNQIKSNQNRI